MHSGFYRSGQMPGVADRSLVRAPNNIFTAADLCYQNIYGLLLWLFFLLIGIVKSMLGKFLVAAALISGILVGLILTTTTPTSAGAIGILGIFVLSYIFLVSLLTFFIFGFSRFLSRFFVIFSKNTQATPVPLKKSYYYSSIIALAPVIILSMQSVNGVGGYEFGLICLLVVLGCLYVAKRVE